MQAEVWNETGIRKGTPNLVGKKFGKLEVLSFSHYKHGKYPYWNCKCECGTAKLVYGYNLVSGAITSCGCGKVACGKKYLEQNLHTYDGVQIEKAMAKTKPRNNTSGCRGVFLDKRTGKWRARLVFQGKRYELGYYSGIAEAAEARLKAEERIDTFLEEYKTRQSHFENKMNV